VIGSVAQERSVRLREERSVTSIALRQDDLVEELDGWVVSSRGLPFVDELVERLSLSQHMHIVAIAMRHAA